MSDIICMISWSCRRSSPLLNITCRVLVQRRNKQHVFIVEALLRDACETYIAVQDEIERKSISRLWAIATTDMIYFVIVRISRQVHSGCFVSTTIDPIFFFTFPHPPCSFGATYWYHVATHSKAHSRLPPSTPPPPPPHAHTPQRSEYLYHLSMQTIATLFYRSATLDKSSPRCPRNATRIKYPTPTYLV